MKLGFQNEKKNCLNKHPFSILSKAGKCCWNLNFFIFPNSPLLQTFTWLLSKFPILRRIRWQNRDFIFLFFLEVVMSKPENINMFQYLFQATRCWAKIASLPWCGYFSQCRTIWKVHWHEKSSVTLSEQF